MVSFTLESVNLLKSGFSKYNIPSPAPSRVKALTKMMNTMTLHTTVTNTIILNRQTLKTHNFSSKPKLQGILYEHANTMGEFFLYYTGMCDVKIDHISLYRVDKANEQGAKCVGTKTVTPLKFGYLSYCQLPNIRID